MAIKTDVLLVQGFLSADSYCQSTHDVGNGSLASGHLASGGVDKNVS